MPQKDKRPVPVHVISDATGITAERVISAVLVQFSSEVDPVIHRYPYMRTKGQLAKVMQEAEQDGGLVIYSLVASELRRWMHHKRRQGGIRTIDLLGPLLRRMERILGVLPSLHPGLLGKIGEGSMRLAECIDFTLRHDDGASLRTLGKADVIIVGVSRTSKTPTSLFLSCNHNLKVANVPIIAGVDPPKKIFTLKRPRKVGLIISPEKLASIRTRRYHGRSLKGYNKMSDVNEELNYCQRVFERIKDLTVIDVTNASIEEVANRIA